MGAENMDTCTDLVIHFCTSRHIEDELKNRFILLGQLAFTLLQPKYIPRLQLPTHQCELKYN